MSMCRVLCSCFLLTCFLRVFLEASTNNKAAHTHTQTRTHTQTHTHRHTHTQTQTHTHTHTGQAQLTNPHGVLAKAEKGSE